MFSYVTFKPANIEGAPVMVVNTGESTLALPAKVSIYLPMSVDEWEIKYYSRLNEYPLLTDEYLKNAGTINMNEQFGHYIRYGLSLELSLNQRLHAVQCPSCSVCWLIPEA